MEITCPSGLRVQLRKLKAKAIGAAFSGVGARKGKRTKPSARLDPLLDFAVEAIIDQGPYRWGSSGRPNWQEVLSGDRAYILLKAREKTFGSRYDFQTQCGMVACRAQIAWQVELSELEIKALPESSKEKLINKEPFEFMLPDGTVLYFGLGTGQTEGRAPRDADIITASVMSRVQKIGDTSLMNKMISIVEELDADVLDELFAEMEASDCGVESSIEVVCDECGGATTIELPFDRSFFMPRTTARKSLSSNERSTSSSSSLE